MGDKEGNSKKVCLREHTKTSAHKATGFVRAELSGHERSNGKGARGSGEVAHLNSGEASLAQRPPKTFGPYLCVGWAASYRKCFEQGPHNLIDISKGSAYERAQGQKPRGCPGSCCNHPGKSASHRGRKSGQVWEMCKGRPSRFASWRYVQLDLLTRAMKNFN